ncbi:MAG TPA: Smr/MutS family protein [Vicinamibacterales bacterium]|nr:Smr/MutS family protein [Vicinamibacterales bacterium]
MTYHVGDAVHVGGLGTGVVREVLNKGRLRVEVKGRVLIANSGQLTRADAARPARPEPRARDAAERPAPESVEPSAALRSLDLHGRTVPEAIQELQAFMSEAFLDGHVAVQIIHGRGGGRIRAAVHGQLKGMPIRSFRLDPRNPGATIVVL